MVESGSEDTVRVRVVSSDDEEHDDDVGDGGALTWPLARRNCHHRGLPTTHRGKRRITAAEAGCEALAHSSWYRVSSSNRVGNVMTGRRWLDWSPCC
jgi:hypothetical protein